MDSGTIKDYYWIKVGSTRSKILNAINGTAIPSEIQKETNLNFSSVSRTLKNMYNKGLVEIHELEDEKRRVYSLSKKGRSVLTLL